MWKERIGASPLRGDVAIIGLGCVYPDAPDVQAFWENILGKKNAIRDASPRRWDQKAFYRPGSKTPGSIYSRQGGFLADDFEFNPLEFNLVPSAIRGGNPDQFLSLVCAQKTLADAGYLGRGLDGVNSEIIIGRGSYPAAGQTAIGLRMVVTSRLMGIIETLRPDLNAAELDKIKEELLSEMAPLTAESATAAIPNLSSGRIANRFDFMGANYNIDAACASALIAMDTAVNDLLSGKVDFALVGGVHVFTDESFLVGFSLMGAMSPSGICRPFDENADGVVIGEGVGMLALKRLGEAERDKDRIYAVIKGVGTSSDGKSSSFVAPRKEGELLAIKRAYVTNNISPSSIDLIEAHGTGTPIGDKIELQALQEFFNQDCCYPQKIAIGSVKSMIGHAMVACGAASLIKTALALHHKILPPSLNCETPHPLLKNKNSTLYLNSETRPWIHGDKTIPRRAAVSAMGFGGINSHAILEEYCGAHDASVLHVTWPCEICVIAADSPEGLLDKIDVYLSFLDKSGGVQLKDVAYTLNSSLADERFRLAIVARDTMDFSEKLRQSSQRLRTSPTKNIDTQSGIYYFPERLLDNNGQLGKIAFVFPGLGSQYVNMLSDLCLHFPEVRNCFDDLDRHCRISGLPMLSRIVFPPPGIDQQRHKELDAQISNSAHATAIVLQADYALYTLLKCLGVQPDMVAGHSAGEWMAMIAAGILDGDGLSTRFTELANKVAMLDSSLPECELLAIGASFETVSEILRDEISSARVEITSDNCPHQVVVAVRPVDSGHIRKLFSAQRILVERMASSGKPYHSSAFSHSVDVFKDFFKSSALIPAKLPVYSYCSSRLFPTEHDEFVELAAKSLCSKVRFKETVEQMFLGGARIFLEVGPKSNLTNFVRDTLRAKSHLAIALDTPRRSSMESLQSAVALLTAHHVKIDFDYLYRRRSPRLLQFNLPESYANSSKKVNGVVKVSLAGSRFTCPSIQGPMKSLPKSINTDLEDRRTVAGMQPIRTTETESLRSDSLVSQAKKNGRNRLAVVTDYLATLDRIAETQTAVMKEFLQTNTVANQVDQEQAPSRIKPSIIWFEYQVKEHVPGLSITIQRDMSVSSDLLLHDHALGAVDLSNKTHKGVPVVPLTLSMEMMAQAARLLQPEKFLVGVCDVLAEKWLAFETLYATVRLEITARQASSKEGEKDSRIEVVLNRLSEGSAGNVTRKVIARMNAIFSVEVPESPLPTPRNMGLTKGSSIKGEELYRRRYLFHGSRFRGITSIEEKNGKAIVAKIATLARHDLIKNTRSPSFLLDPCFLDACGQLVGYWVQTSLPENRMAFPLRIRKLTLYRNSLPQEEEFHCLMNIVDVNAQTAAANIDVVDQNGQLWMRIESWEDWRFPWPDIFVDFGQAPEKYIISEKIPLHAVKEIVDGIGCFYQMPKRGFESPEWQLICAHGIFALSELARYHELSDPFQQKAMIVTFIAIKDVVRSWLNQHYDLEIHPAAVLVFQHDDGEYRVNGHWVKDIGLELYVSATYDSLAALAVAVVSRTPHNFALQLEKIKKGISSESSRDYPAIGSKDPCFSRGINLHDDYHLYFVAR